MGCAQSTSFHEPSPMEGLTGEITHDEREGGNRERATISQTDESVGGNNRQLQQAGELNAKILSKTDLFAFLNFVRDSALPGEMLYVTEDFLPFCLASDNLEALIEACAEFGKEIGDLHGLLSVAQEPEESRIMCAVKNCNLCVVKFLCEVHGLVVTDDIVESVVFADNVPVLNYFVQRGSVHVPSLIKIAISFGMFNSCLDFLMKDQDPKSLSDSWVTGVVLGELPVLQWASKHSIPCDDIAGVFEIAAKFGYIPVLEHLWTTFPHVEHCPFILRGALGSGKIEALEFAVAKGADISNAFCLLKNATTPGHVSCLKYLYRARVTADQYHVLRLVRECSLECIQCIIEHGGAIDAQLSVELARNGNLEGLQLAHRAGCPWDERTCAAAAKEGHFDCLKYAHENGCPLEENSDEEDECKSNRKHLICQSAVYGYGMACLKYVVEQGARFNSDVLLAAVENGYIEKVLYLLSKGCPADARAPRAAAKNNFFYLLCVLHEHGCPWDGSVFEVAGHRNNVDCVRYAHENGCPWPLPGTLCFLMPKCRDYMIKHGCPEADQTLTEGSVLSFSR